MASTTTAAPRAPGSDRLRQLSLTQRILARPAAGALISVVFVWVVFAALSLARGNAAFLGLAGTLNYLDVAAQIGVIATSVALLMIAGEFDLSIGSMVGFAGIVMAILATIAQLPLWLSIILGMVITTFLGVINGYIVVRTGLPSFIVTLATLFIIRGASSVLTSSVSPITYIPLDPTMVRNDPLGALFGFSLPISNPDGSTTSVQVSIFVWVLIALIGIYVLGRTRFGNWIAGVGGSGAAARNLGVPVARVKITLFMTTAVAAWLVAMIEVTSSRSADVLRGEQREFYAIIAVVIGGVLLTGGYGTVVGAVLGALIYGMVRQGVVFAGIDADWVMAVLGAMLLAAVLVNRYVRQQALGARA